MITQASLLNYPKTIHVTKGAYYIDVCNGSPVMNYKNTKLSFTHYSGQACLTKEEAELSLLLVLLPISMRAALIYEFERETHRVATSFISCVNWAVINTLTFELKTCSTPTLL